MSSQAILQAPERVPSGLPVLGPVGWGTHICHFYRTAEDLAEVLVPFFAAGLANHERCVWVSSDPLPAVSARDALRSQVPDLDQRLQQGDIEILDFDEWYVGSGPMSPRAVLDAWIERETRARRDGFTGLRITGNTSFLARGDVPAFCGYEAKVNERFRDRRILALCSYPLDRIGHNAVVDVLGLHGAALVKRAGRWELATSATALLEGVVAEGRLGDGRTWTHALQFLDDGNYPDDEIAGFFGDGFERHEPGVVIAVAPHLESIRTAIRQLGFDVDALTRAGQLVLLDARQALDGFLVNDTPDPTLFDRSIGAVVASLASRDGRQVRAYGEMVNVLWQAGAHDAALSLERMWSELLGRLPVRLLCGYSSGAFAGDGDGAGRLAEVCAEHEGAQGRDAVAERAAGYVLGQTQARLRALQQMTAALCRAVTIADVRSVIGHQLPILIGALGAELVAGAEWDGGQWPFPADEPVWTGGAEMTGALPLVLNGRPSGVLRLRFPADRTIAAIDRALFQDLARLTAATVDRAQLYEQAQRVNREKDRFLAVLGHELRNPLAPIFTALQLMKLRDDQALAREREIIERQATNLRRLVEDLLDVSRIVHGKLTLERAPERLDLILAEAIEVARPLVDQYRHALTVSTAGAHVWIDVDRSRIVQALANLLTNAAKYTPADGRIALTVRTGPERVAVSVRDNGIGIPAELLTSIFESFVQAQRSVDRGYGGLGLGLTLARQIAELHGGALTAKSYGAGRGSEFVLELPMGRPSEQVAAAGHEKPAAGAGACVLVVDDNADSADMLVVLLRAHGYDAHSAYAGREAMASAATLRPDVVLMDLDLPDVDGHEVARHISGEGQGRPVRFIALSGLGTPEDRERSRAAGFAAHLVKPVELIPLLAALR